MTILVDGPDAIDIEDLQTYTDSSGRTAGGSFYLPIYRPKIELKKGLTIITDFEGEPEKRWHIVECELVSAEIFYWGTQVCFTAQGMNMERP